MDNIHNTFAVASYYVRRMTKDCIAAGRPYFSSFLSNFWACDKFAYGPLATMSIIRPRCFSFSSLPMHMLAEEFPDGLNSPKFLLWLFKWQTMIKNHRWKRVQQKWLFISARIKTQRVDVSGSNAQQAQIYYTVFYTIYSSSITSLLCYISVWFELYLRSVACCVC